jgi:hypothetical protein
MSEELNLSSDLLKNEELDVEGHMKREGAEEAEEENDVEGHLLNNNLLLDNQNLLDNNNLL